MDDTDLSAKTLAIEEGGRWSNCIYKRHLSKELGHKYSICSKWVRTIFPPGPQKKNADMERLCCYLASKREEKKLKFWHQTKNYIFLI